MSENHREVVVLKFSHFKNFNSTTYGTLVNTINDAVKPWLYTGNSDPAQVAINDLMNNQGRVIVVIDGNWANANAGGQENAGFFIYRDWCANSGDKDCEDASLSPTDGEFNVYDQYSNTTNYHNMATDQINKFNGYNGKMQKDANVACDLFLLSWTLTPPTNVEEVSKEANRDLGRALDLIVPNLDGFIPNVLYVDFYERSRVTDEAVMMNQRFPQ